MARSWAIMSAYEELDAKSLRSDGSSTTLNSWNGCDALYVDGLSKTKEKEEEKEERERRRKRKEKKKKKSKKEKEEEEDEGGGGGGGGGGE